MTKSVASQELLVPLIPRESLSWNGFPLFHVGRFEKDFSGRLYFVLGQGLGDHVNGFRILHELQNRFPAARYIVYADRRWEELALRMGHIEIRWYPKALDPRSGKGINDPYAAAHETLRKEIGDHSGEAFLAYDHFPMPDRHARGETTLEAISRAIGLNFCGKSRPFLPILEEDGAWADVFLEKKGLERGRFALLAPFSWPNKRWSRERFSLLIDALYEELGLRSLLVSYPEVGSFDNPGVVMAYSLSLGQIAGLLSRAGLFVGLDSGPTHMAAAFDLPMVVIFVERKTIPFEVRALTPFALHVVEGFVTKEREPSLQTVRESVSFVWKHRKKLSEAIPRCPACGRQAHYVWGMENAKIDFGCVCGLVMGEVSEKKTGPDPSFSDFSDGEFKDTPSGPGKNPGGTPPLSGIEATTALGTWDQLRGIEEPILSSRPEKLDFVFEKPSKEGYDLPLGQGSDAPWEFRLSQDALVFWMDTLGYTLLDVAPIKSRSGVWSFTFVRMDNERTGSAQKGIRIPWADRTIRVSSPEDYGQWYSFEKWGHPEDLVGIVKSMAALGYYKEAFRSAWVAFTSEPSLRSLRWVGKSLYFRLLRRDS